MNRACAIVTRLLVNTVGVFALLSLALPRVVVLVSAFALMLCVEVAVAVADKTCEKPDNDGRAGCGTLAAFSSIAFMACICWPRDARYHLTPETWAAFKQLEHTYDRCHAD